MSILLFVEALGLPLSTIIAVGIFIISFFQSKSFNRLTIKIDRGLVYILLFSVFYSVILYFNGYSRLAFIIHPPLYYLIGMNIACDEKKNDEKIIKYIMGIVLGALVHVVITYIYNGVGISRYSIVDVWTGLNWNATGIASCLVFSAALLPVGWMGNMIKWQRVFMFMLAIVALLLGFWCGSRTLMVVMALDLIVMIFLITDKNISYRLKLIIGIIAIAAVLIILFRINFMGFSSRLSATNLFRRYAIEDLNSSDDRRLEAAIEGVQGLIKYPFGGNNELHYAHNLWLDVGRQAGIVPMVFLIFFFIFTGKNVFNLRNTQISDNKIFLLTGSIFVAFTLDCLVEPILSGMELQFLYFVLIMGMVSGRNNIMNSITRNSEMSCPK